MCSRRRRRERRAKRVPMRAPRGLRGLPRSLRVRPHLALWPRPSVPLTVRLRGHHAFSDKLSFTLCLAPGVEFSLPSPSGVGAGASRCYAGPGESALPSGTFQGHSLLPPFAPCNPSGAGDSGFMRSRGTRAAPSPVKASAMLLAGLRFAQKSSSAGSCSHIPQAERGSVSVQVRAIPGQSCCLCRGWAAHSVSEGGLTFSHGPEAPDVARAGLGLRRHMLAGHLGGAPLSASSSARALNAQAHRLECLRGGFSQRVCSGLQEERQTEGWRDGCFPHGPQLDRISWNGIPRLPGKTGISTGHAMAVNSASLLRLGMTDSIT